MTLAVSSDSSLRRIETTHPVFVQLTEAQIQLNCQPSHDRLVCAECGHQVSPERAVQTLGGYFCSGCVDSSEEN